MTTFTLTPTPEVQRYLEMVTLEGATTTQAAEACGLYSAEATLIRRLAGLRVVSHPASTPKRVVQLRENGMTHKQIAQTLGISPAYVNYLLKKNRDSYINSQRLNY